MVNKTQPLSETQPQAEIIEIPLIKLGYSRVGVVAKIVWHTSRYLKMQLRV